ncbi:hypothetical protein IFJ75_18815 [Brevundimonas goettingensis]|uniref:Uncharacterized protein n=1 Tax=Brevundimonas goettingensis TaxID=2774190 RepID=A0A975C0J3_9CAUL|nr:hypothetical protein IFJ75_18815 [Brevundimonas goettingensis]
MSLSLQPGQLPQLLSGDALTLTAPAGADDGGRYPAPPKAMAEAFLRDCLRR